MSFYLSHPDIPAYRPVTYPKRRRLRPRLPVMAIPVPNEPTYQDFFTRQDDSIGVEWRA